MSHTETSSAAPPPPLVPRIAKGITGFVAFVGSVLAIVFVLWPSLKPEPPSPTRGVSLSGLRLERPVTFGAYLRRVHQPPGGLEEAELARRGALASFDFVIEGYKDRRLPLTWQLIDEDGGNVLEENRDVWIEPEVNRDSGTWPIWVPEPRGGRRLAFIQVELYEPRGVVPLETLRTRTFRIR
jgi:hypothetical protein